MDNLVAIWVIGMLLVALTPQKWIDWIVYGKTNVTKKEGWMVRKGPLD